MGSPIAISKHFARVIAVFNLFWSEKVRISIRIVVKQQQDTLD